MKLTQGNGGTIKSRHRPKVVFHMCTYIRSVQIVCSDVFSLLESEDAATQVAGRVTSSFKYLSYSHTGASDMLRSLQQVKNNLMSPFSLEKEDKVSTLKDVVNILGFKSVFMHTVFKSCATVHS